MIIVEKAYIKYRNGEYDMTINSEYVEFKNEKEAKEFIKKNIKKDYEFYLYKSHKDLENCNHYNVVISNKKRGFTNEKKYL